MKKRIFFLILILAFAALLRLYRLGNIPASLYSDEADQLYNAYSILTTGKDEHGRFLPVSFRSFGDWKPPLQTYVMLPFVALVGSTETAARFPSAIMGIGTIILTYFIVQELAREKHWSVKLALLSAFTLAASPWHILESRAAMLVMVALFFYEAAVLAFIKGAIYPNRKLWLLSSLPLFAVTTYAYYGMRLCVPLTVLLLFVFYRRILVPRLRVIVSSAVVALLVLFPLIISFTNEPDVVLGRARTVSVFYDQGISLRKWELTTTDAFKSPLWMTRLFHNSYYLYAKDIARRFFSHLEGEFLFVRGDQAQPFQIPGTGILLAVDILLLPLGLYWSARNFSAVNFIAGVWIISIVPASLTFLTPASNRTFSASVPIAVIGAGGIYQLGKLLRKKITKYSVFYKIAVLLVAIVYSFTSAYFFLQYFRVLPKSYADWWNWGWKEAFVYLKTVEGKYDSIFVYDRGMPYIYLALYQNKPPDYLMQNIIRSYQPDQFGFEHVDSLGKYMFNHELDWPYMRENMLPKSLYVIPGDLAADDTDYTYIINYPNGKPAFKFFENES